MQKHYQVFACTEESAIGHRAEHFTADSGSWENWWVAVSLKKLGLDRR
jgi:hypothetical protein